MSIQTRPTRPTTIRDLLSREAVEAAAPRPHGEGRLLAIDLIDPNPFQHRLQMDPGKLEELMESIRVNGLIEPVPVRRNPTDPGRYQLIAGHRRHRAFQLLRESASTDCERLQWSQILAVEKPDISDRKMRVLGVVENADRDDTSPVEQGMALIALQESEHLTREQLIQETGWAENRVKRLLRIARSPEVVRDACTKGIMVQLRDEAGAPLMTPKGRPAQEHRTLDLFGALEFDLLYRHYTTGGTSDRKAAERIEKHITTALVDGWGFRRIQEFCRDQRGGSAGGSASGEKSSVPSPQTPPLYRDDERQLVVYKTRLADASPEAKRALRTALEEIVALLQTTTR